MDQIYLEWIKIGSISEIDVVCDEPFLAWDGEYHIISIELHEGIESFYPYNINPSHYMPLPCGPWVCWDFSDVSRIPFKEGTPFLVSDDYSHELARVKAGNVITTCKLPTKFLPLPFPPLV